MSVSQIFFYSCLFFVLGIFIGSFFCFSKTVLMFIFLAGIFLVFPGSFAKLSGMGICLIFLCFGISRYQSTELKVREPLLKDLTNQEISLIATVIEEPENGLYNNKLIVELSQPKEKILITTSPYPEYKYGDRLGLKGKLEIPEDIEGFNYTGYLKKDYILYLMRHPEIKLLGSGYGNPIKTLIFPLKNKIKESLNSLFPVPYDGFLQALILGEESNISKDWKEKLNKTGTRHIVAVSGMNITIICQILLSFILALGFYRQQAIFLSIVLIILFVLMIGAPASAVRAAIMGILVLLSQLFGRIPDPTRLIVFALSLMLFTNPLLLRYDIGFQLSFAAVFGLIYLSPLFLNIFKKLPNTLKIKENLSSTLAAQTFTFPLLVYNFGQISLISPLANVLILPLLPYLTIFGFFTAFLNVFFKTLGGLSSLLIWPPLLCLTKIIELLSKFPIASIDLKISLFWLIMAYCFLTIFVWRLSKKGKLTFLDY